LSASARIAELSSGAAPAVDKARLAALCSPSQGLIGVNADSSFAE
jgi:hypothetical protein